MAHAHSRSCRRLRALADAVCPTLAATTAESLAKSKPISDGGKSADAPWATVYTDSSRFRLAEVGAATRHLDEHGCPPPPTHPPPHTPTHTHTHTLKVWELTCRHRRRRRRRFTIFRDVLTTAECDAALDKFWGFFECLGADIDRHRPETWGSEKANLVFTDAGVVHPHGVIQSEAVWTVRGHPNVARVFASLWDTDDLIASFDGLCAYRPWNLDDSWRTRGPWFHTDQPAFSAADTTQSPSGFKREYIQGFVNLIETSPASGGNVVIPGSHLEFEALAQQYLQPGRD